MKVILRTACGCEKTIDWGDGIQPYKDIVLPLRVEATYSHEKPPMVRDRHFKLTGRFEGMPLYEEVLLKDASVEEMEKVLYRPLEIPGLQARNMMVGYFGLKSREDLYKLRELVYRMLDLFSKYD